MPDLMKQSTLLCLQLGEARRLAKQALAKSCEHDREALAHVFKVIESAYVNAEGYDLLKAKQEFEDKHSLGAPYNQHILRRERDYLNLLREVDIEQARSYERPSKGFDLSSIYQYRTAICQPIEMLLDELESSDRESEEQDKRESHAILRYRMAPIDGGPDRPKAS